MRKMLGVAVVVSLTGLGLPALAQEAKGTVVAIHCLDPLPGAGTRLEDGMKRHLDWHRRQKDAWRWATWMVMTGPDTGQLCTGSFDHKWEDFDKPGVPMAADAADAALNIMPSAAKHQASFWVRLDAPSRPAAQPAAMSSVVIFQVRLGMDEEFNALVGEFHKAIEKAQMPWRYTWYALASGGDGGSYALVLPRNTFADFNPSAKPFAEVLADAYGKRAADALQARWREVVAGSRNYLITARPDLSYTPTP
jgi:hypothetical protein